MFYVLLIFSNPYLLHFMLFPDFTLLKNEFKVFFCKWLRNYLYFLLSHCIISPLPTFQLKALILRWINFLSFLKQYRKWSLIRRSIIYRFDHYSKWQLNMQQVLFHILNLPLLSTCQHFWFYYKSRVIVAEHLANLTWLTQINLMLIQLKL